MLSAIRLVRELIAAAIFRQSDLLDEAGDAGFGWDDISAAVGVDANPALPQTRYTFDPPSNHPPRFWKSPRAPQSGLRIVLGKPGDAGDTPGP